MGDLATEIEQMQNDLNAFDDELDALEQWVFAFKFFGKKFSKKNLGNNQTIFF